MGLVSRAKFIRIRRSGLMAIAVTLGAVALIVGAVPSAAQASGPRNFQQYNTHLCLGAVASVYTTLPLPSGGCDQNDHYEFWYVIPTSQGGSTLKNYATSQCLDSNSAGQVYVSPCNGNNRYENWNLGGQGPGKTVKDLQTGRCLDGNGAGNVYTSPCNWKNLYQNWIP